MSPEVTFRAHVDAMEILSVTNWGGWIRTTDLLINRWEIGLALFPQAFLASDCHPDCPVFPCWEVSHAQPALTTQLSRSRRQLRQSSSAAAEEM